MNVGGGGSRDQNLISEMGTKNGWNFEYKRYIETKKTLFLYFSHISGLGLPRSPKHHVILWENFSKFIIINDLSFWAKTNFIPNGDPYIGRYWARVDFHFIPICLPKLSPRWRQICQCCCLRSPCGYVRIYRSIAFQWQGICNATKSGLGLFCRLLAASGAYRQIYQSICLRRFRGLFPHNLV